MCVDLHSVTFIDAQGKELLAKLHREGASLAGKGCLTRAIISDVTGQPVTDRKLLSLKTSVKSSQFFSL